MSDERNRCEATTKAGKPCKNYAMEDSRFCRVHQDYAVAADTMVAELEEQQATSDPQIIEEAVKAHAQQAEENAQGLFAYMINHPKFSSIIAELDRSAQAIQEQLPNYTPPPFNPQEMLRLMRQNVNRFTPELVKDLQENLKEASAEDFKDPETWKGLWFLLTYSIQEESKSLLGRIQKTVSGLPGYSTTVKLLESMPGASMVKELGEMLEGATPQDFMDKDTWAGIWYVINHSIQTEAEALRSKMMGGSGAEEEDEIIEIRSD